MMTKALKISGLLYFLGEVLNFPGTFFHLFAHVYGLLFGDRGLSLRDRGRAERESNTHSPINAHISALILSIFVQRRAM